MFQDRQEGTGILFWSFKLENIHSFKQLFFLITYVTYIATNCKCVCMFSLDLQQNMKENIQNLQQHVAMRKINKIHNTDHYEVMECCGLLIYYLYLFVLA